MIYYILLMMIIIALLPKLNKNIKFWSIVSILLIITVVGFAIGTDYLSYEYLYNNYNPLSINSNEIGYEIISLIGRSFNVPFHWFSVIIRTIITLFLSVWMYQSSEKPIMSIIIYYCMFFYIWSMSSFRQGLVLGIGSYYFMNKTKELNIRNSIFLILALSTIHASALFYFVILGLTKIEWTKKKHLLFLGIGLISTFLPLAKLLNLVSFIPGVSTISPYITGGIGFFDFASFMRLFFFLLVYVSYESITESKYMKKIVDLFLAGVSIYFVLKFSEISAARFTLFTFVNLVIILPVIINFAEDYFINHQKILFIVPKSMLILVLIVFIGKDFVAYKSQIGYVGDMRTFDFMTLQNQSYKDLDNRYALHESQKLKLKEYKEEFHKKDIRVMAEDETDSNYVVIYSSDDGLYGLMNSKGEWKIAPKYERLPFVYDDVLLVGSPKLLFREDEFISLNKKDLTESEMETHIKDYLSTNYDSSKFIESDTGFTMKDVLDESNGFLVNSDNVSSDHVYRIEMDDFVYHILYFNFDGFNYYIYMDEEYNLYSDILHTKPALFENGFLKVQGLGGTAVYNKEGKLLWVY